MIYTFFICKMSKFSKKHNRYKRVELIACDAPLERVGLYVTCLDANFPLLPVTACIAFQDKATGHQPEDGAIDGYALAVALSEMGLLYLESYSDPENR